MLEIMTDRSVSGRKRSAILEAALTIFSQRGYAEASVDDVAEEARVAKGTLYLYFKSKEELYLAALASDLRAMAAEARKEMERAHSLREKLRAFLRVRLEYTKSRENFLRIYLAEYGSMFLKTTLSRELIRMLKQNMRYVARVIEESSQRGEIGPVPAGATAAALFDLSRGLAERRLLRWKEFWVADEIEFSIDVLLSGIEKYAKSMQKRSRGVSKREGHRASVV
jgi:AcrR family transcriptional regulator